MAARMYLPEYSIPLDRWVVPVMRPLPARTRARPVAGNDITDVTRALPPGGGVPGLPDWEYIPTPGHSPGYVAYLRRVDGVLVSGDAVLAVDLNSVRGVMSEGNAWRARRGTRPGTGTRRTGRSGPWRSGNRGY